MRGLAAASAVLAVALPAPATAAAGPARDLAAARERWAAQHALDYSYRIRVTCFCPVRDPVTIRVRDGRPRGTPRRLRRFDTAEELFARIAEQLHRTGEANATYGRRTGIPRGFDVDPIPRAIDDEYLVTVKRPRVTRRG